MEFTNLDINSLYPNTVDISAHIIKDNFELIDGNTGIYIYGINLISLQPEIYVLWCQEHFKDKFKLGQKHVISQIVWFKEEAHRNWFLLRWQP